MTEILQYTRLLQIMVVILCSVSL